MSSSSSVTSVALRLPRTPAILPSLPHFSSYPPTSQPIVICFMTSEKTLSQITHAQTRQSGASLVGRTWGKLRQLNRSLTSLQSSRNRLLQKAHQSTTYQVTAGRTSCTFAGILALGLRFMNIHKKIVVLYSNYLCIPIHITY